MVLTSQSRGPINFTANTIMQAPTLDEIRDRLRRDIAHHGGVLPERNAIAWSGYLAALIEWGLISVSAHSELRNMIPKIPDDPSVAILLGFSE